MKLPLHTANFSATSKRVDLIDANGVTVALDLTPVSGAYIANAVNNADAQAARIAELEKTLRPLAEVGRTLNIRGDAEVMFIWTENSNVKKPIRLSVADAQRAAHLLDGDK